MVNGMLRLLQSATEGQIPSENIDLMWSTLITGLVVVFMILVILVILLWALGKVMNLKKKPKKTETAAPAAVAASEPEPAPEVSPVQYDDSDDEEIIAVISAAIAAYGQSEGKQYRIASVKKREKALRSNWSAAGISENTRPF